MQTILFKTKNFPEGKLVALAINQVCIEITEDNTVVLSLLYDDNCLYSTGPKKMEVNDKLIMEIG